MTDVIWVAGSAVVIVLLTFLALHYLKKEAEDDADINIDEMT
jgi:hypothetical protein